MHHIESTKVSGRVEHMFAHRFTVRTADAVILADLTPHGARHVPLKNGDDVVITGEQKPSEIRVESIAIGPRTYVLPPHPEPRPEPRHGGGPHHGPGHHDRNHGPHHHGPGRHGPGHEAEIDVDTTALKATLASEGYAVVGEARLRHRHAEFLARKGGNLVEVHVEFDGHIRKVKPADVESKWAGRTE
jgi:hypothetical protein